MDCQNVYNPVRTNILSSMIQRRLCYIHLSSPLIIRSKCIRTNFSVHRINMINRLLVFKEQFFFDRGANVYFLQKKNKYGWIAYSVRSSTASFILLLCLLFRLPLRPLLYFYCLLSGLLLRLFFVILLRFLVFIIQRPLFSASSMCALMRLFCNFTASSACDITDFTVCHFTVHFVFFSIVSSVWNSYCFSVRPLFILQLCLLLRIIYVFHLLCPLFGPQLRLLFVHSLCISFLFYCFLCLFFYYVLYFNCLWYYTALVRF